MKKEVKSFVDVGITKSSINDTEGIITIKGIASSMVSSNTGEEVYDRDIEQVDLESEFEIEKNADGSFPLFIDHKTDIDHMVGKVTKLDLKNKQLHFEAEVHRDLNERVYKGVKNKVFSAVSIGFRASEFDTKDIGGKSVGVLSGIKLHEISIVGLPANTEAVFSVTGEKTMILTQSVEALKAANPDCDGFECKVKSLQQKGVITYGRAHKDPSAADIDIEWDRGAEVKAADVEDLKVMCAWVDSEKPDLKGSYKFPHHRQSDKAVVFNGIVAGMVYLDRADIPDEDRKGVYNHLAKHYRDDFDKEPPEYKSFMEMSESQRKKTLQKDTNMEVKEAIEKALTLEETELSAWNRNQQITYNLRLLDEVLDDNFWAERWGDIEKPDMLANIRDAFREIQARIEEIMTIEMDQTKSFDKEKEKEVKKETEIKEEQTIEETASTEVESKEEETDNTETKEEVKEDETDNKGDKEEVQGTSNEESVPEKTEAPDPVQIINNFNKLDLEEDDFVAIYQLLDKPNGVASDIVQVIANPEARQMLKENIEQAISANKE